MTKKEILNIVKMKYGGNVDAFYKDYPTPESFKNGGSIPQYGPGGEVGPEEEPRAWKGEKPDTTDMPIDEKYSYRQYNRIGKGYKDVTDYDDGENNYVNTKKYNRKGELKKEKWRDRNQESRLTKTLLNATPALGVIGGALGAKASSTGVWGSSMPASILAGNYGGSLLGLVSSIASEPATDGKNIYKAKYANGGKLPMYAMGGNSDPILTGDTKKPFTTSAVPVSDTKYKTNEAVDVAINENPISLEDAEHRINVGNNSEAYWNTLNSAFGPPQGGGYTIEQMQTYPEKYKQFQDDKTWLTEFTGKRGRPNDSYTMYGGTNESGVPVKDMAFGDTTYKTMMNPATSVIKKDTANTVTTLPGDTVTGVNSLYKNKFAEPIAQNRNGGYLNSYNNGGKLPMYENGTNNAYMTNFSNTGTSTNYNAYMPNGIDYSQPASDNTFGATNYSADTLGQTFDTSTKGDNINTAVGTAAGSNPYSSAIYTGATMAQELGKNNIKYEKDIYGNETNVPVAGSTHLASATKAPWEVASEAYSEGEYGKAAVAATIPVAGQLIGTQQIKKQQEEFAKEQELAAGKETEFQKRQALLADRESSELDKANAIANNTSGFGTFMGKDGGYANFNPQAEIENGELIEGTTGTYKAEGDTHENGGIEIGFSENGTPIAGEGGKLTKMYEGGGKMSSAFVSSNNMKVPKDMAERLLKI